MDLTPHNVQRGAPLVRTLRMDDPTFESLTVHVAHATFVNPKPAQFSYTSELYLGKFLGDRAATSGQISFDIPGGGSKIVDFSVSMPSLAVESDSFHVYLEVTHAGVILVTYVSIEDVIVTVTPAIDLGPITWD